MSNTLVTIVRDKLKHIKGPSKAVLVALADRANEDSICWPSHATIAADTGLGRSTVRKHVKLLADAGLLVTEKRSTESGDSDSNRYRLTLGGMPPDSTGGSPRSIPLPPDSTQVGHHVAGGGSRGSTKASLKHQLKHSVGFGDDGFSNITTEHFAKWSEVAPGVDHDFELEKADAWLRENKKPKSYSLFLLNWMKRAKPTTADPIRPANNTADNFQLKSFSADQLGLDR